eukprot:882662-Rhodomonas_salina.5
MRVLPTPGSILCDKAVGFLPTVTLLAPARCQWFKFRAPASLSAVWQSPAPSALPFPPARSVLSCARELQSSQSFRMSGRGFKLGVGSRIQVGCRVEDSSCGRYAGVEGVDLLPHAACASSRSASLLSSLRCVWFCAACPS